MKKAPGLRALFVGGIEQQIPCGNDNQKSNGKTKNTSKSNGKSNNRNGG
jgi:hypothetical protein